MWGPSRDSSPHGAQICLLNHQLSSKDFHGTASDVRESLRAHDQPTRECIASSRSGCWRRDGNALGRQNGGFHHPTDRAASRDEASHRCSLNRSRVGWRRFRVEKRAALRHHLVDLEARKTIDILPDRTCATVAKWLAEHPEIEIISRDRGTDYAAAAREAAPQARQIADRFHLVRNLADALQPLLTRCRTEARQAKQARSPEQQESPSETRTLPHPDAWRQHPPDQVERRYKANQEERESRFQQIATLRSQGLTMAEIGQRVGIREKTVRRWLKQGSAPIHRRRKKRFSRFDPYAAFVLEQWQAGVQDGTQIYEAIRVQGFTGDLRMVQRFLQTLREKRRPIPDLGPPDALEQCAGRQVVWFFIRKSKDLTDEEQGRLSSLRQASALIETIYGLVQDFLLMVRERQGERLDAWLDAVQASQIPELQRFALGLLRDKEAVVAGLTQIYSNGPVEAQVHKLKLVTRQAFGRAKLPLLRQHLLHAI